MSRYGQILFLGTSILTLSVAGCMDGSNGTSDAPEGEATAFSERPSNSRLVERDVEAPEVFQTTDQGLWDGRPSLGGVWVAYPGVTNPERVIIRNDSNGKFVIGALFKREREHPGPKLQVSSDAAASLGLLAGQPTNLNVTALRREEPAPAQEATAPVEAETIAAAEPVEEQSLDDPIASAAAAVDSAESGADVTATGAEIGTDVAAVEPAPEKKKRNWNPFRRKQQTETLTPASATATTAAVATGATIAATSAVTTEPLPAVADEPAAAPAAIAETRKASSSLDRPYVQIGIFSVETNANNTAEALRQNGVVPKVFEQESSGKTFWRVVAGPASTKSDRSALLKKVKGMGFGDAYPVGG